MLNFLKVILPISILLAGTACHRAQLTTMHLKEGEYLLKKNKVKIVDNKKIDKEELSLYIRQQPNNSYLFGTWKAGLQWKNIWYKENNKKGNPRPAVILDTNLVSRSLKQLEIYLQNLGYYDAKVESTIKHTKILGINAWTTKKAIVSYKIETGKPFYIDSVGNAIEDSVFKQIYVNANNAVMVKKNANLEVEKLQLERERLSKLYQNKGYYDFTEKYVYFDVDTSRGDKKTTVITTIKRPVNEIGQHYRYSIRNIYVQTDYDELEAKVHPTDTLFFKNEIQFTSKGPMKYEPLPLYKSIFIKPGEFYSAERHNQTYKQLMSLGMFSYVNIDYQMVPTQDSLSNLREMDVVIQMTPAKKWSISTEATLTYREGFGANGVISLSNKNLLGYSELVDFRLTGGFENLQSTTSEGTIIGGNFGPRLSVRFPMLLFLPRISNSLAKNAFPKSTFSTSYNYQKRDDFTRYLSNLYFRYDFNEGLYKKHELNIVDISFSYILKDSKILSELTGLSASERYRFEDQISLGMKYRFTYNNEKKPGVKHPIYFIGRINVMGGSSILTKALNVEKRDVNDAITWFGIRYTNFLKLELDYRYYRNMTSKTKWVFRFFSGAGVPFDKYSVIPFEQLYFSGGANSVRGWQQRTLGPGGHLDSTYFYDRLGEIKLESSLELRFPIAGFFKGAVFVDAGNVWNLTHDDEKAVFKTNTFVQQIAVSPGIGLRLDFDFFLFRVDVGFPIKQPYKTGFSTWSEAQPNWNFGIGYPF